MLSCSIWFSAASFWMGGGLESRCVGRVCGVDGAVRLSHTAPTTSEVAYHYKCVILHTCITFHQK